MSARPLPEDLFIARWRDRLGLAFEQNDDAALIKFAKFMFSISDRIDVTHRRPRQQGQR